jgi:hypothetical protein
MTKDAVLRLIEAIDDNLAELRRAVEELPDTMDATQAGPWPEQGRENTAPEGSRAVQFLDKVKCSPMVMKSFREMDIGGEPIGAENVQAMIEACGIRPEDNAFSREIVEMREE